MARNITPAFAAEFVFVCETTRATSDPSELVDVEAKLNWSLVPKMSAPAPMTVNVGLV